MPCWYKDRRAACVRLLSAPEYDVWQRDSQAHIVHHRGLKTTGYAMFDIGCKANEGSGFVCISAEFGDDS